MAVCGCERQRATYWPPAHRAEAPGVLGTADEFCSAFFHVLPCRELQIPYHVCLRKNARTCGHQCVTAVVRVQTAALDRAVRYTTCRLNDGTPVHAEEFVVADETLLVPGATLTLYVQIQPCHHSNLPDSGCPDAKSCTEMLVDWHKARLSPIGITLRIRAPNLYKAMWTFTPSEIRDTPASRMYSVSAAAAREGLRVLTENGLGVAALTPEDWQYLVGLAAFVEQIPPKKWAARFAADAAIRTFLSAVDADT